MRPKRSSPILKPLLLLLVGALLARGSTAADGGSTGQATIGFWPAGQETGQPFDPADCEAHLVRHDGAESENVMPCRSWIDRPGDAFTVWLEAEGLMSEIPVRIDAPAVGERQDRLQLTLKLAPAGTVRLAPGLEPEEGQLVRLLHLESHNRGKRPGPEMLRALPAAAAREGALMPAGPVLALLYGAEEGEYLGVGRPVAVRPGAVAEVAPRPPQGADLFVILERPRAVTAFEQYDVELGLTGEWPEARAPDLVVPAAERLYAVWLDLPPSQAVLELRSPVVYLPPQAVVLRSGAVAHLAADLRPRPDLDVFLELPETLRSPGLALEVEQLPEREVVRRVDLRPDEPVRSLHGLPPAELVVVLEAPPWKLRKRVDLSDGHDSTVVFAPTPIFLSGTVYLGDEPRPAALKFYVNLSSGEMPVETDDEGYFETVLFRPGTYIALVQLTGGGGPPQQEMVEVPDEPSFERDFHIAAISFHIRVVSAETGEAIPDARIGIENQRADGFKSGQNAEADEKGFLEVAHLHPGTVKFRAFAEGYLPFSGETLEVGDGDQEQDVVIRLEPAGRTVEVRLLLASGAPASGAEVAVQESLNHPGSGWTEQAGADGRVEVPKRFSEMFFLARHPLAASAIRRFPELVGGGAEATWSLGEPAPQPLSILVRSSWGEPARWAPLVLWIQGRRVAGPVLGWLTYSRPTANADGFWQGTHLPAASVRVLAFSRALHEQALGGAFDGLAVEITYPWNQDAEVPAIE